MDFLSGSVQNFRGVLKNPDLLDAHVLSKYMDKVKTLTVELQRVKREILSFDHYGECIRKVTDIEQSLFDLKVAISCLMERMKKDPITEVFRVPMMARFNLP